MLRFTPDFYDETMRPDENGEYVRACDVPPRASAPPGCLIDNEGMVWSVSEWNRDGNTVRVVMVPKKEQPNANP